MSEIRRGIAAIALACVSAMAFAQGSAAGDPLAVGRQMLNEDNPGDLWTDKGKELFYAQRGPAKASLEQCDFGLGPGKLDGATTRLPRYFPDTDKVQDLESRLLTCMVQLQGFKREDIVKRAISPAGSSGSDVEALALYITSRSNGMKMNVALSHQKEYDMYKAGEYLFYRRSGQTDFACIQCHGEAGKRIRLQDLVNMTEKKQIQETVSTPCAISSAIMSLSIWRMTMRSS